MTENASPKIVVKNFFWDTNFYDTGIRSNTIRRKNPWLFPDIPFTVIGRENENAVVEKKVILCRSLCTPFSMVGCATNICAAFNIPYLDAERGKAEMVVKQLLYPSLYYELNSDAKRGTWKIVCFSRNYYASACDCHGQYSRSLELTSIHTTVRILSIGLQQLVSSERCPTLSIKISTNK